MSFKKGDKVRMTEAFKKAHIENTRLVLQKIKWHEVEPDADPADHIKEFGNTIGIVQGLTDYGNQLGPEIDVKWGNLRYSYNPEDLEKVEE